MLDEARKWHKIPGSLSYKWLWATCHGAGNQAWMFWKYMLLTTEAFLRLFLWPFSCCPCWYQWEWEHMFSHGHCPGVGWALYRICFPVELRGLLSSDSLVGPEERPQDSSIGLLQEWRASHRICSWGHRTVHKYSLILVIAGQKDFLGLHDVGRWLYRRQDTVCHCETLWSWWQPKAMPLTCCVGSPALCSQEPRLASALREA